jgi:hypothetical protein
MAPYTVIEMLDETHLFLLDNLVDALFRNGLHNEEADSHVDSFFLEMDCPMYHDEIRSYVQARWEVTVDRWMCYFFGP